MISDLVKRYQSGNEYEIRCNFPVDRLLALYRDFGSQDFTRIIRLDAIERKDDTTHRRELFFTLKSGKLAKTGDKFVKKKQIASFKEPLGPHATDDASHRLYIKHVLSSEDVLKSYEFGPASGMSYTLKCRDTFVKGDWNWDFSITFTRDSLPKDLLDKVIFSDDKSISFADIWTSVQSLPRVGMSLEIEYTSAEILTYKSIASAVNNILQFYGGLDVDWFDIASEFKREPPHGSVRSLKQIVEKPITLTKNMFGKLHNGLRDYFVTDKADGDRCLIVQNKWYTETEMGDVPGVSWPSVVMDAEKVGDRFLIFDLLRLGDDYLLGEPYWVRLKKLMDLIPDNDGILIRKSSVIPSDPIVVKEFYERDRPYGIDGVILTPEMHTSEMKRSVLKWKPPHLLTTDFLIKKVPEKFLDIYPFNQQARYALCCGISSKLKRQLRLNDVFKTQERYGPVVFQPTFVTGMSSPSIFFSDDDDLDGVVGEFIWQGKWQLVKVRHDKTQEAKAGVSFGNDYRIADQLFTSVNNPLTMDVMMNYKPGYFAKKKPAEYRAITYFNGRVKEKLIKSYAGKNVVDLACGRGQDAPNYNRNGVDSVLMCDIDLDALEELGERRYALANPMRVNTMHVDLTSDTQTLLDRLATQSAYGASSVFINFAIHYIIKDTDDVGKIGRLVSGILAKGGKFVFTCFDGTTVNKAFTENGDINLDGKFHIKKKYTKFGLANLISVKHHFADYYDEHLLDVDKVVKILALNDLKKIESSMFSAMMSSIDADLDAADKKYASFYRYVVMQKG